ncbi:MAG: peptide chain release factor N(5)-glutamine methyltransferase, partial [Bacilli bacterium]
YGSTRSMITHFEAHKWASSYLEAHGCEEQAAEWLLLRALGVERYKLLMNYPEPMNEAQWLVFENWVKQHATGVPVQYLAGVESFYGRDFLVTSDTLVPRPETEELVQAVLAYDLKDVCCVDIGTGTGAIAISLKAENPTLDVHAVDIYAPTLDVARQNAKALGVQINFHLGDLLQPLLSAGIEPTILVSNPPYIPEYEWEQLSVGVRDYEPKRALVAENDGLALYEHMLSDAAKHWSHCLHLIAFEVGYNQAERVSRLLQDAFPSWTTRILTDINGKDRIVIGEATS